jgi:hypothetical protein
MVLQLKCGHQLKFGLCRQDNRGVETEAISAIPNRDNRLSGRWSWDVSPLAASTLSAVGQLDNWQSCSGC